MSDTETLDCPLCDRTFQNQSALISHKKTHKVAPEPGETPRFDWVPQDEILGTTTTVFHQSAPTGTAPQMPTGEVRTATITYEPEVQFPDHAPAVRIKLKKLPHYGTLPNIKQATAGSAGFDLYAAIRQEIAIGISQWELIPTGLCIEVPLGYVAKIVPRSGLAANNGITVLNTPGIVDADYRGEIKINLVNNTTSKFRVLPGMRIAQMLIEKVVPVTFEYVEQLSETSRGAGGFGSTGI